MKTIALSRRIDDRRRNVWVATALLGAALLLVGSTAFAAEEVNVDRSGVALKGFDPVAYFDQGEAIKGSDEITATHDGATYRFASEAHRKAFVAEPAKYLPAYGGWCAYGVAKGKKYKIDPEAFTIRDGQLYLNYDKGVQKKWEEDVDGYIAQADSEWPRIEHVEKKKL